MEHVRSILAGMPVPRRALAAATLVAVTLTLALGPVDAWFSPEHDSPYGEHYLRESDEYGAARCIYNDQFAISRIRVKPPIAFARDRNANVNSEWIRWRGIIEGSSTSAAAVPAGGVLVKRLPWRYAYTSELQPAEFVPVSYTFPPDTWNDYPEYYVGIQIQWLGGSKANPPVGSTRHNVTRYSTTLGSELVPGCVSSLT